MPEEENQFTRWKKENSKKVKAGVLPGHPDFYHHQGPHHQGSHPMPGYYSPIPTHSPYMSVDTPVFDVPYIAGPVTPSGSPGGPSVPQHYGGSHPYPLRPSEMAHRRTVSVPNLDVSGQWTEPPSAPVIHSPAMFDSPQWMASTWSPAGVNYTPQGSPYISPAETMPTGTSNTWSTPPPPSDMGIPTPSTAFTPPYTNVQRQAATMPTPAQIKPSHPQPPPLSTSWSTPNLNLQIPNATQFPSPLAMSSIPPTPAASAGPSSSGYYTPYAATPSTYASMTPAHSPYYENRPSIPAFTMNHPQHRSSYPLDHCHSSGSSGQPTQISPTLAPEMSNSISGKEFIGLGIRIPTNGSTHMSGSGSGSHMGGPEVYGSGMVLTEDYFAAQAGY